jgi:hypothetical protein
MDYSFLFLFGARRQVSRSWRLAAGLRDTYGFSKSIPAALEASRDLLGG